MQRIHCTPHAGACQAETISDHIDRTVDLTEVFQIFQYLNTGKEFDSKQFSSRKMESKVEENKILALYFPISLLPSFNPR